MQIKKKLIKLNKLYIFFFSFVLFINIIFTTTLNANSFKINDLEITEPFELNFNKEKVIDKGFRIAFFELASKITTSGNKKKIQNTTLSEIKGLIDSFTMSDEKFVNNEYKVRFDVNFNKKNTLIFFEKKNIFPSIPRKKKLLLIPIFVNLQSDQISLYTDNIFYKKWNEEKKRYYLLDYIMPVEDLEDVNLLLQNSESIEDYDFKQTINKYDLKDYIIIIIYKNNFEFRILSKIRINEFLKIDNKKFDNLNLNKEEDIYLILNTLKTTYENYWKDINQINTSIKLPIAVSIDATDYKKIQILENSLDKMDLVSSFEIVKLNNNNIYFKIIYNGSPKKFINEMKINNFEIETQNQIWKIK